MGDPEFRTDEKVLLRTPGVYVKSIPFEGILTTKRIILVDRAKNLLPPKEIPLATIKTVEAGENAIRDQILTLSVLAKTGDTRQMVLTFSRQEGGNRIKERDEWFRQIQGNIGASFENVIRKVIPTDAVPRKAEPPVSAGTSGMYPPAAQVSGPELQIRREAEGIHPTRKIIDNGGSPAVKEFDASQLGQAIFCNRCGNKVPSDSAFCNRCGSPVVPPAPAPAAAAPAPAAATPPPASPLRPIDQEIRSIEPLIEKTDERIPADPLKKPIPDIAVPKSISWDDDAPEQAARAASVTAPPGAGEPAAKQGILPRLFSSKAKVPSGPAPVPVPSFAPPVPEKPRRSFDFARYRSLFLGIGAILVILVVVAIGALVVYPMISGSGQAPAPAGQSTGSPTPVSTTASGVGILTTGKIIVKETEASAIPQTGVIVHVNYLGGFKGSYGMKDALTMVPGNSGDRMWEVENANMTVIAEFEKLDGSAHELIVEIYKDGKVLTRGSTTTGHGYVKLSVDPLTGTAAEPVTSGGGTSAGSATVTPAPTKTAAANATAVVTTVVPTTGTTTAPAANTTTSVP